jgi:acetylornithine deacetylase/succinyl-diaminopimelate desuccinylase-like protein
MRLLAGWLMVAMAGFGATPAEAAREWRRGHEKEILAEYLEFLAIPNVARDIERPFVGKNADWIVSALGKRGVAARKLAADGAPPVVYGEIKTPGATQTVMFYAHYDGQPVDVSKWTVTEPWKPRIVDGRIYARSASDDKAPIQAMLSALDSMKAAGVVLKSNVKFFFDGEEEAGSRNVRGVLERNRELLAADVWIFCDGPQHASRRDQIVFGARGTVGFELTVYGADRELHSGHYGNWAPNPAQMLVGLAASMRNDEGLVLIEGFEKGLVPLSASEIAAIREAPDVAGEWARELALGRTLGGGERIEMLVNRPVLNLRGLSSAAVGKAARNVVPSTATASFDIRLVKGIDGKTALERVAGHVRGRGYHVVTKDPDAETLRRYPKVAKIASEGGYNAVRTSMDLPIAQKVVAAVEAARGPVVKIPTMGGSLPMAVFAEVLGKPLIIVPVANHDNNQHSHNENLRLENLWAGMETLAALMGME